MKTTQRTYEQHRIGTSYEPTGNFTETTTGDAPASIAVEFNAKGVAQIAVKVYQDDGAALAAIGSDEVIAAIMATAYNLDQRGIVVAGISHENIEAWHEATQTAPAEDDYPF